MTKNIKGIEINVKVSNFLLKVSFYMSQNIFILIFASMKIIIYIIGTKYNYGWN